MTGRRFYETVAENNLNLITQRGREAETEYESIKDLVVMFSQSLPELVNPRLKPTSISPGKIFMRA